MIFTCRIKFCIECIKKTWANFLKIPKAPEDVCHINSMIYILAAKSAISACQYMKHGCCIDGITPCKGKNYEGCTDREGMMTSFGSTLPTKRCRS